MDKHEILRSEEFGDVRIEMVDGKILFCASDVAKALGYDNPARAIVDHCKSGDIPLRYVAHSNGIGGTTMRFIPEGDVYRLIARSRLPAAQKFESWVFDEVLPAIRKDGGFILIKEEETEEQLLVRSHLIALKAMERYKEEARIKQLKIEEQNAIIEEQSPIVNAYNTSTKNGMALMTMEEVSKNLDFKKAGRNNLFKILREGGFLSDNNYPKQKYIDQELFTVKEVLKPIGPITVTMVTHKGKQKIEEYLISRGFIKKEY